MIHQLPQPTIFAHRGSSAYAPENTLAAFELSVAQNVDAIELDAKLCADGEIIVFHDQTLERTTNGIGKIIDHPLSTLKELDAGSWFDTRFESETIPTLGEVFETVGDKLFINVELTNYASPRDSLPYKVVELVTQYNLQKTVLFSSFNPLALWKVQKLLPEVPVGLLALPGFRGAWARSRFGNIVPHQALHPEVSDTDLYMIKFQHRRGCRVHVWTVNMQEKMRQLFKWGVDGIFTDDPLLAQEVLQ
jgi:glycerophosphoryl diester phosphodiesterase